MPCSTTRPCHITTISSADRLNRGDVVGDENVADAKFLLQAQQKFQDAFLHDLVQCRCDLVADDQFGFGGQRAGDADALLLPA